MTEDDWHLMMLGSLTVFLRIVSDGNKETPLAGRFHQTGCKLWIDPPTG
jgi:hypothetical protein